MNKLFLLLMPVLLSSCMTLNKAKRKMRDNPVALAEMCALHFPATDKFIKGDPVIEIVETARTDTVEVEVEGKTIKVVCPECRSQTKTITVTDTIVRLDEASLAVLLDQINTLSISEAVLTYKNSELKKEKRNLVFALIGSVLGLFGMLYMRFKP